MLQTPGRVLFTVMLQQCLHALALGLAVNASNTATSAQLESPPVFQPGLTLSDFCHKDHLLLRQQAQDTVHFTAQERKLRNSLVTIISREKFTDAALFRMF